MAKNIPKRLQADLWLRLGYILGYQVDACKEFMYKGLHGELYIGIPNGDSTQYRKLPFNLG